MEKIIGLTSWFSRIDVREGLTIQILLITKLKQIIKIMNSAWWNEKYQLKGYVEIKMLEGRLGNIDLPTKLWGKRKLLGIQ